MKISVSSYSLGRLVRSGEMTLPGMVDWLAELGVGGVEFIDFTPADGKGVARIASSLRSRCEKHGLAVTGFTVGANLLLLDEDARAAEVARIKQRVETAAKLGVTRMRHDVARGFPEGTRGPRTWARALNIVVPAVQEIADHAARHGITTSMENHGFFSQASERVQRLVRAVNRDNFRVTVDIGNFLCVDEEPVTAVRRLARYASHVHVKDFHRKTRRADPGEGWFRTAGKNWLRGAIVGHGNVDVRRCLSLLKRAGYDGWYSIEFEGMEDPRLGVRVGVDNLRRYLEAAK